MLTNLSASRMHSCHNKKNSCLLHVQALVALQEHSMPEHCQQLQNTRPHLKPGFTGLASCR